MMKHYNKLVEERGKCTSTTVSVSAIVPPCKGRSKQLCKYSSKRYTY